MLIGGDFNDIMEPKDRVSKTSSTSHNKTVHIANLSTLIRNNSLVDVWRYLHNDTLHFTRRSTHGIEKSRIDYWLIDENTLPLIKSCDIRPAMIKTTDHLAVSLKLNSPVKRGPGYWKSMSRIYKTQTIST
mgnify:CR=1 FL=1